MNVGRLEPLSPFVPWTEADRSPIPDELLHQPEQRSLLLELLREPRAIALRALDQEKNQMLVLSSLAVITLGASVFEACVVTARGATVLELLRATALLPIDVLAAIAAAIGPIYVVGIFVSARIPLARLVSTLLASVANASLLLTVLGPIVHVLFARDPLWAGPLALVFSFLAAALVAGLRIRGLLGLLAEEIALAGGDPGLSASDRFRVGILARMAMVYLGFTTALAMWALDAFL
jgi:hypothetical protein